MQHKTEQHDSFKSWGYFAAFATFVAGPCIVVSQCYRWLRDGEWPPVSVITALQLAGVNWSFWPTDWLGLHKMLNRMPLSVALNSFSRAMGQRDLYPFVLSGPALEKLAFVHKLIHPS